MCGWGWGEKTNKKAPNKQPGQEPQGFPAKLAPKPARLRLSGAVSTRVQGLTLQPSTKDPQRAISALLQFQPRSTCVAFTARVQSRRKILRGKVAPTDGLSSQRGPSSRHKHHPSATMRLRRADRAAESLLTGSEFDAPRLRRGRRAANRAAATSFAMHSSDRSTLRPTTQSRSRSSGAS